jgi:outer membrane protein assembly factor BamE (lipoprotein component of BamABCDE complex)
MKTRIATAFTALLLLAACAPTVETRGNIVSETNFKQVTTDASTRADVEQKWGPPTTVSTLDPNTWYYIGETTAQEGVFEAKVTKRRLIRVRFDASDKVVEISDLDPRLAKDIRPVDRTTPTAGKEYTVLQQFVGNLGKFNTDKKAGPGK